MKIRQYVYLRVRSDVVPTSQMTAVIGFEPDSVSVKGSKRSEPPVPRGHRWAVECRDPGAQIGTQVEQLLTRLRPHHDGLRRLSKDPDITITLELVRYLNADDGQDDTTGGWLAADTVAFLASISAGVDIDEYDLADGT